MNPEGTVLQTARFSHLHTLAYGAASFRRRQRRRYPVSHWGSDSTVSGSRTHTADWPPPPQDGMSTIPS